MTFRKYYRVVTIVVAIISAVGLSVGAAQAATSPSAQSIHSLSVHRLVPNPAAKPFSVIRLAAGPNDSIGPDKLDCYNSPFLSLSSHMYVSEEQEDTSYMQFGLRARSSVAGPWEQWYPCYDEDTGLWHFKSAENHLWVSEEQNFPGMYRYMLRARATNPLSWESFDLECVSGGIAIYSWESNMYVSTEMEYPGGTVFLLRARSQTIGPWEVYRLANPNVFLCL